MLDAQEEVLMEIIRPSGRMKCKPFNTLLLTFLEGRSDLGGRKEEDYPKTLAYLQEFGVPRC
jgi:hypothetical protein